jgi:2OG-Fe(II) oxygenase superfamily
MGKRNEAGSGPKGKGKEASSESETKGKPASSTAAGADNGRFPSHLLTPDKDVRTSPTPQRYFHPPPPPPLQTLLPGYIWVIPRFFSEQECQNWIEYVEREVRMEHTVQRGTRYVAQRECYRTSRSDPRMSERIFQRLLHRASQLRNDDSGEVKLQHEQQHCHDSSSALLPPGSPYGCNQNLRLYKYTKGHSFGKHVDESVVLPDGSRTRLTALIYLSSCEGGATRFYEPRGSGVISYQPTVGSLLLHLHGDDCLEHEGDVVTGGTKYVLRTDVAYRRS